MFIDREPVACVLWMLEWIWGDLLSSCNPAQADHISDVDRLFEKGPLNIYAEDCIVTHITWKTVQRGVEMNNGTALLLLQQHQTELHELLKEQLEKCVLFLESLLSTNWNFNRNLFSHFYRAFVGISVIAMLTEKLEISISPVQSRIMAIVDAVKKPSDTGGISFHPKIQQCMGELCRFLIL